MYTAVIYFIVTRAVSAIAELLVWHQNAYR